MWCLRCGNTPAGAETHSTGRGERIEFVVDAEKIGFETCAYVGIFSYRLQRSIMW